MKTTSLLCGLALGLIVGGASAQTTFSVAGVPNEVSNTATLTSDGLSAILTGATTASGGSGLLTTNSGGLGVFTADDTLTSLIDDFQINSSGGGAAGVDELQITFNFTGSITGFDFNGISSDVFIPAFGQPRLGSESVELFNNDGVLIAEFVDDQFSSSDTITLDANDAITGLNDPAFDFVAGDTFTLRPGEAGAGAAIAFTNFSLESITVIPTPATGLLLLVAGSLLLRRGGSRLR